MTTDLDDPNNWDLPQEYRIYASNVPDFFVRVSQPDYSFLAQNSWSVHTYTDGKNERRKLYLRRSVSDFYGPDGSRYESEFTGKLVRNRQRVQRNLFLHFVVMIRKTIDENCYPPDKHHHLVDHEDRDTRNCTRPNLRWATHSKNNHNSDRY